jgi:hypothetical protein
MKKFWLRRKEIAWYDYHKKNEMLEKGWQIRS